MIGGQFLMRAVVIAGLLLVSAEVSAQSAPGQGSGAIAAAAQPTIQEQMEHGEDQLALRRYDEAIQIFNGLLARIPDYGPALAQRARAYAWTNRLVEATRDIDAAARTMPDSALLHAVRGTIAQRRSDDATAIIEYSRTLAMDPGNQHALRSRAYLYREAGNHEAALADAEAYIAAHPEQLDGYVLKADLLIGQRRRALAAAEADRLIRMYPNDAYFLTAAARIYDALADRVHALAAMDRVVAREPDSFIARLARAEFRRWDDFAGRRADLDSALQLEPGHGDVLTYLGLLDFKERRWTDAVARFSSVLAREPRDFGLLAYRAMAHLNAGEQVLAERDFRTAVDASEGANDFNLICASLAHEGVALDRALEACNRAVGLNASESSYRANRGLVELRLDRLEAALADYDAAIAADASRASGYYGRALVHQRRGERQAAAADRAEALAIDPGVAERFQSYGLAGF